ncbi:hypothetical protein LEP1GSC186_4569 [Leptospira noguchii serovar Autumnalis str. ZUN142]|uniref:Uncharacterized protein n=1 Tax=Leptospira noguchii serovar Autumnalis str. ZUN142 TaxID=1085540 RepID=M6UHN5_9LEPT|nr:hypothetical protein LEP1GSC186_4569 [Leptospira noguchii serovar Autumnalis str. ZUN142]
MITIRFLIQSIFFQKVETLHKTLEKNFQNGFDFLKEL